MLRKTVVKLYTTLVHGNETLYELQSNKKIAHLVITIQIFNRRNSFHIINILCFVGEILLELA